jgi:NADH-ubiquinone oxidoreductase chain 3
MFIYKINFVRTYQEKYSIFECGFHSFLGQNRTQFGVKFFIFALVYLVLDLEIVLIFPYAASSYENGIYGLSLTIGFIVIITLGFVFELGKEALRIDSKQTSSINSLPIQSNNQYFPISNTNISSGASLLKSVVFDFSRRSFFKTPSVSVGTQGQFIRFFYFNKKSTNLCKRSYSARGFAGVLGPSFAKARVCAVRTKINLFLNRRFYSSPVMHIGVPISSSIYKLKYMNNKAALFLPPFKEIFDNVKSSLAPQGARDLTSNYNDEHLKFNIIKSEFLKELYKIFKNLEPGLVHNLNFFFYIHDPNLYNSPYLKVDLNNKLSLDISANKGYALLYKAAVFGNSHDPEIIYSVVLAIYEEITKSIEELNINEINLELKTLVVIQKSFSELLVQEMKNFQKLGGKLNYIPSLQY